MLSRASMDRRDRVRKVSEAYCCTVFAGVAAAKVAARVFNTPDGLIPAVGFDLRTDRMAELGEGDFYVVGRTLLEDHFAATRGLLAPGARTADMAHPGLVGGLLGGHA